MKDEFVVNEPRGQRWEVALEILEEGKGFVLYETSYWLSIKDKILYCSSVVNHMGSQNISQEFAEKKIKEVEELTDFLKQESGKFSKICNKNHVQYLVIHDYGTGVTELYRKEGNKVVAVI